MKQSKAELKNMRDLVISAAENYPDTDFFICKDNRFPSVTGEHLLSICRRAQALLPRGDKQEHIALLGPNSAAWIASYFAIVSSGNVAVPLHHGLKHDELRECILMADCGMLFFDESCSIDADKLTEEIPGITVIPMHEFLEQAETLPEEDWKYLTPDTPAAMYFTSGTTARSRCVVLTHKNLASQINAIFSVLPLSKDDTGLSILPLSHTFEMMTYVAGALHCGGTLYINDSLRNMKANLKKCRPTILVAVPLILQTLHKEIVRSAEKQGKLESLEKGIRLSERLRKVGINAAPFFSFFDFLTPNFISGPVYPIIFNLNLYDHLSQQRIYLLRPEHDECRQKHIEQARQQACEQEPESEQVDLHFSENDYSGENQHCHNDFVVKRFI